MNDNPSDLTLWADFGKDFYATTSFSNLPPSDGRRIWMGWISNWLYANDEPTPGWRGAQSVPRVLGLRRLPAGLRLTQEPVRELESLRTGADPMLITGAARLPPTSDIRFEVHRGGSGQAGLRLSNGHGEEVVVGIDPAVPEVFVDRREARAARAPAGYPGRHAGPVRWRDGRVSVRIIFDRSVVEVFANDGETVVTDRVYPTRPFDHVELLPETPPADRRARLWALGSVWDSPGRSRDPAP